MTEPTPRQVLYALVAAGFVLVVAVLVIAGASAGITPTWWSASLAMMIAVAAIWMARNWRRTAGMLSIAIGLFVVWMVGTLILAT